MAEWSYFSNHGHVLVLLANEPDLRLRDLAERIGITERAVHRLIGDLEAGGALVRERCGRRTVYSIDRSRPLRHPIERHRTIDDLVRMVWGATDAPTGAPTGKSNGIDGRPASRSSPPTNGTNGRKRRPRADHEQTPEASDRIHP